MESIAGTPLPKREGLSFLSIYLSLGEGPGEESIHLEQRL